jgi:hypothetical protein
LETFELNSALVLLAIQCGAVVAGLLLTGWLWGPRRVKFGNVLLMALISWAGAVFATIASAWLLAQLMPEWGVNPWANRPLTAAVWAILTAVSIRLINHKRPSDMALGLICVLAAGGYLYLWLPRE